VFRFVSVRTERKKIRFAGHPNPSCCYNKQGTGKYITEFIGFSLDFGVRSQIVCSRAYFLHTKQEKVLLHYAKSRLVFLALLTVQTALLIEEHR
jgi:hypothetical protein